MRPKKAAIIGSGPAALMSADVLSSAGISVSIFEKRKSIGRKLLIAGSSGLNISNSLPPAEFAAHYSGPPEFWKRVLAAFSTKDWIKFIEALGIGTFEGTSGRYFIEDMKASKFLQAWSTKLLKQGVSFFFDRELADFSTGEPASSGGSIQSSEGGDDLLSPGRPNLEFRSATGDDFRESSFDAVFLGLGGGSWEPLGKNGEDTLRWPSLLKGKGLGFTDFTPSNVGYEVNWPKAFLAEAEGKPLKNVVLTSRRGSKKGDAMITAYGIEGTPVYFTGETGRISIDLKPDLSVAQIEAKLRGVKENLSPIRRIKKVLNLCPASFAMVFHCMSPEIKNGGDLQAIARSLKSFSLLLGKPRPLSESISSAGGLQLAELNPDFMLKKFPGFFAAGEMLDWDVPTGGFLIQGCVSQGYCAGMGILRYLKD